MMVQFDAAPYEEAAPRKHRALDEFVLILQVRRFFPVLHRFHMSRFWEPIYHLLLADSWVIRMMRRNRNRLRILIHPHLRRESRLRKHFELFRENLWRMTVRSGLQSRHPRMDQHRLKEV